MAHMFGSEKLQDGFNGKTPASGNVGVFLFLWKVEPGGAVTTPPLPPSLAREDLNLQPTH